MVEATKGSDMEVEQIVVENVDEKMNVVFTKV